MPVLAVEPAGVPPLNMCIAAIANNAELDLAGCRHFIWNRGLSVLLEVLLKQQQTQLFLLVEGRFVCCVGLVLLSTFTADGEPKSPRSQHA